MPLAFTSCETDDDSNPRLDLSHVGEGFVLNTPAYAKDNVYDLAKSEGVWLSCTQPNYGSGVPYVVNYHVQLSLDPTFASGNAEAQYKELSTSYTTAKMQVSATEMNSAVVELYQKANPDEALVPDLLPVYVRLRATIDGGIDDKLGETGQTMTVDDLLMSIMVKSANDAAVLLAEHSTAANAGRAIAPGDLQAFVQRMNRKARALGMLHTHYETPNGYPPRPGSKRPFDTSTCRDLAKLARAVLRYPEIFRFTKTKLCTVVDGDGRPLTCHI